MSAADDYVDDVLDNCFWPGTETKTTITKADLRVLLKGAFYGGQDSVIHPAIDYLHGVRWTRDNVAIPDQQPATAEPEPLPAHRATGL